MVAQNEHVTEAVPVDAVTPHPDNPRRGNTAAIAASLREHGQYKPLTVQRSTGRILVGNNTYAAIRDVLGWDRVWVHYVDVDDDRARRILAVDNRSSDLAEYDDARLASLLDAFDGDLSGTGFDADAVDALLSDIDPGPEYDPFHPAEPEPAPPPPAAPPPRPVNPFPPPPAPDPGGTDDDPPWDTDDDPPHPPPADAPDDPDDSAEDPPATTVTPWKAPLTPVRLEYDPDDHHELLTLVSVLRAALGSELSTSDVVLRAVRTLVAAVDARHMPDAAVSVRELLAAAS